MTAEEIKKRQEESKARKEARVHNKKILEEELLKPYTLSAPNLGNRANDLQFFHDLHAGKTYAVLPPDADELRTAAMKLLGGGKEVAVNVRLGVAKLNKGAGDTYNRRIGRIVATSKLSVVAMKLTHVNLHEARQTFIVKLGHTHLQFYLEKKTCPKFVSVYDTQL